jgi:hypothetical protein
VPPHGQAAHFGWQPPARAGLAAPSRALAARWHARPGPLGGVAPPLHATPRLSAATVTGKPQ